MKESMSNIFMSIVDTIMVLFVLFSIFIFSVFGVFWGAIKTVVRKDVKHEDEICRSDHGDQ